MKLKLPHCEALYGPRDKQTLQHSHCTEEAEGAFQVLKRDLQTAPALGNPDYTKLFHLYVAEKIRIC